MRIDECARVYYMCEYVCCHATRRFFFTTYMLFECKSEASQFERLMPARYRHALCSDLEHHAAAGEETLAG